MNDAAVTGERRPAGARAWISALGDKLVGPYPAASILALLLACWIDVAAAGEGPNPRFLLYLTCLALGLGAVHGLAWQLVRSLLRPLPAFVTRAILASASLALGCALAHRLGAFANLTGRYRSLALGVLLACGAGAAALAVLLAAMQPTPAAVHGFLGEQRPSTRHRLALALLCGAGVLVYADLTFYVGLYAAAHLALRAGALWCAMLAFVLVDRELRLPRLRRLSVLPLALAVAVPLARLDEQDQKTLADFEARRWPALVLAASRTLLDFDRDGFSSLLGGGDCAPFNARIHPQAREIPDNGIDDNCLLGDAQHTIEKVEQLGAQADPSPLDVVLITIDTLRPDHLGVYNPAYGPKGRATSPNLDRWAQKATVFQQAFTPGGWTSIVIPSLMRGLYPRRLQWTRWYETNLYAMLRAPLDKQLRAGERVERAFPFAYQDPHPSLAARLKRRGMHTAAVVDDGYSEILKPGTGVESGFALYRTADSLPPKNRNDAGTVTLALSTLRQVPRDQRFFLWVHLFGPHVPNEQHLGLRSYGTSQIDLYDHEIAFLDQELERLLSALAERTSPVAVFIAADHGEQFEGRVRYHGYNLNDEVIRVPLLAQVPGWPAGNVEGPVSLVDLTPTIVALTHTRASTSFDGMDLTKLAQGAKPAPRILLSDTWRFEGGSNTTDLVAAYDGRRKVVFDRLHHLLSASSQRGSKTKRTKPVDHPETDPLSRTIYGYLEDTGGELRIRD